MTLSKFSSSILTENQKGYVLVVASMMLVTLLTMGSIAVDLGLGYVHHNSIQHAADSAAYAGVARLHEAGATYDNVIAEARAYALANGITDDELTAGGGIDLGTWTAGSGYVPQGTITNANTVRVRARRTMGTVLAMVIGQTQLQPTVVSIAKLDNPTSAVCLQPFGIDENLIEGLNSGAILEIDANDSEESPGNWGALEIGNFNGSNFSDVFVNGVCDEVVNVGESIDPYPGIPTGENGVDAGFDERIETDPVVTFALTSPFPGVSKKGGGHGH